MKIMCDTNVIMDMLLERKPFADSSCKVLSLCEEHRIDGFVSASSAADQCDFSFFFICADHYIAAVKFSQILRICFCHTGDHLVFNLIDRID